MERHRCGIVVGSFQLALRCCRQWPESMTLTPSFGEAIPHCTVRSKACGFWALRWATPSSYVLSWRGCLHDQLMEKVLSVQDLQCAWLLLLHCCSARANYTLRVVLPELTARFAAHHDTSLRRCLSRLLGVAPANIFCDLPSLPLSLGGLGLRSATLLSRPAYWSSWADCLQMVQQRHPTVCAHIVDALHAQHPSFHLAGVRASGEHLAAAGFHALSWQELAAGARPEQLQWDEDMEPGLPRHGWQRRATEPVHGLLVEGTIRPRLSPTEQALFRSQGGPLAGVPYMCFPTSRLSRMDSSLFRVLLLRRLWLPLRPSSRYCRCGRPLDPCGHHRAACAQAGVLGRRGYALESAATRVCPEAGARVSTNVLVRDLDLLPLQHADARRLEVVVDGLPLFHGAQIAVDTTLVSPLRRDGTPHSRCAREDGAALRQARQRKERVYPELSGAHGRARLVVLASEVGGRWSGRKRSSVNTRARSLVRNLPHFSPARNLHGFGGGA